MTSVLRAVVDEGTLFEIMPAFAPNIVCAFARMNGRPVAVVANNPNHLGELINRNCKSLFVHASTVIYEKDVTKYN